MHRKSDPLHSALMTGWVRHRRRSPVSHSFSVPLCMLYLDLSEIDRVFGSRLLWSSKRAAPIRFHRGDYLINDDPSEPLDLAVRRRVASQVGQAPTGPIRLLTIPRTFSISFNPVSFYYCFDSDGQSLHSVVAEITNTPWFERHAYVLPAKNTTAPDANSRRWRFDKAFHISPFMPMQQRYDWACTAPPQQDGQPLGVHMKNLDESGRKVFDATMRLRRKPLGSLGRLTATLGWPAMNLQVSAGIYAHAGLLRLKGAPFFPHPKTEAPLSSEEIQ
jgi:DUF1365 family protein